MKHQKKNAKRFKDWFDNASPEERKKVIDKAIYTKMHQPEDIKKQRSAAASEMFKKILANLSPEKKKKLAQLASKNMKNYFKNHPERRMEISQKMSKISKGRIHIYHPQTLEQHFIQQDEYDKKYKQLGFLIGQKPPSEQVLKKLSKNATGRIHIHNPLSKKQMFVYEYDFENIYKQQGFIKGRPFQHRKKHKLVRTRIIHHQKLGLEKIIKNTEFEKYYKEGWRPHHLFKSKTKKKSIT